MYHVQHTIGSYEEEFALDLLINRQMYRWGNIVMAAVEAARGNGKIPRDWFRAVTETEEEAEALARKINMERFAQRVFGTRNQQ